MAGLPRPLRDRAGNDVIALQVRASTFTTISPNQITISLRQNLIRTLIKN
jgi:hypothetical protein